MAKRRKVDEIMEVPPAAAIGIGVLCILISIAFWINIASIAKLYTREDANHVSATILSWRNAESGKISKEGIIISCSDGNQYDIRRVLYKKYKDEVQAALSSGAEVSMYTTKYKDIIELTINGHTVIPFEEGYKDLSADRIGYSALAAFIDICGVALFVYGIVGLRKERELQQ